MYEKLSEAKKRLEQYGQLHVLNWYNEINQQQKNDLLDKVLSIDFDLLNKIYMDRDKKVDMMSDSIEPIESIDLTCIDKIEIEKYVTIGKQVIKNNQYAVVTMAGGQGTRLGHNGPKGTFMLDIEPSKSIFEILCDKFKQIKDKYDVVIPWYIMTSSQNNDETIAFFEKNNYFGYPKSAIKFFMQGELPMLDENGKVLMEEKWKIKQGPDGNGGIFEALKQNGIMQEINEQNIKWIYICGVDNILANMIDLILLGLTIDKGYSISSKSVSKVDPQEKAGVFCKKNGRITIVNYTEIPQEMSTKTDERGHLIYGDVNIVSHLFSKDALNKIKDARLPYHVEHKKSDYVDEEGNKHIANEPNAYKFETYMFDSFEMFDDMLILRTQREKEFAPIKNKDGIDSPQTAKKLYMKNIL